MEITSLMNSAASKRLQRQGIIRTADGVGRVAQYILQLSEGNTAHFGKKGLIKMRWVRKEKKEASPVVDASLQNPQPKSFASSQLTIFIVNALTSQNPREMPICSPPPTLQELLLHNQRMKTFAIQRPNRDLGPLPPPQLQK